MGWTGIYTTSSRPTKEILREEFTWSNENGSCRVLDIRTKSNVSYVALERTYTKSLANGVPGPMTFVIGVVVLHRRRKREFTFKDISEDMGPYDSQCPACILDLLSPVETFAEPGTISHEYATKWRKRCREMIRLNRFALDDGAMIRFQKPIEFTDGAKSDTFTVHKRGRRTLFRMEGSGGLYRITRWKERDFEVLSKSA